MQYLELPVLLEKVRIHLTNAMVLLFKMALAVHLSRPYRNVWVERDEGFNIFEVEREREREIWSGYVCLAENNLLPNPTHGGWWLCVLVNSVRHAACFEHSSIF